MGPSRFSAASLALNMRGITVAAIARACGVSRAYVSAQLAGTRNLQQRTEIAIRALVGDDEQTRAILELVPDHD